MCHYSRQQEWPAVAFHLHNCSSSSSSSSSSRNNNNTTKQQQQPNVVCVRKIQKSNAITQALQDLERLQHDGSNFGYTFLILCHCVFSSICDYFTRTLAKSWLSVCNFAKVKQFNVKIFYMTMLKLVGCGVRKGKRWSLHIWYAYVCYEIIFLNN